jgi:hypothetical protein
MAAEKGRGNEYPVKAYLIAYDIPADIDEYVTKLDIECKTIDQALFQT